MCLKLSPKGFVGIFGCWKSFIKKNPGAVKRQTPGVVTGLIAEGRTRNWRTIWTLWPSQGILALGSKAWQQTMSFAGE